MIALENDVLLNRRAMWLPRNTGEGQRSEVRQHGEDTPRNLLRPRQSDECRSEQYLYKGMGPNGSDNTQAQGHFVYLCPLVCSRNGRYRRYFAKDHR